MTRLIKTKLAVFNFELVLSAMMFCLFIIVAFLIIIKNPYKLSRNVLRLTAAFSYKINRNLTHNTKAHVFIYNNQAFSNPNFLKTQGMSIGKTNNLPSYDYYAAKIPSSLGKGITYYDPTTKLTFSMVPTFNTMDGKAAKVTVPNSGGQTEISHLVYPLKNLYAQLIYTPESNGVKEDLVLLKKPSGDSLSLSYKLRLPNTLQARLNSNGSIGIYSADSVLYGNISYGTPGDQALIQKAKINSKKTNLVFDIPAPYVKMSSSSVLNPDGVKPYYTLQGNVLTLKINYLNKLSYPINIDPSVIVSTANSFIQNGNNESNVNLAANQISTSPLNGGVIGGWTTNANPLPYTDEGMSVVADNNYIYILGGYNGSTTLNTVEYATISGGAIGAWTAATNNFTNTRANACAFIYNGYVYIMGGSGTTYYNDIQYSQLGANGAPGPWTTNANSFTTARYTFACQAVNGFAYIMGGNSGPAFLNDTQYAAINADGSIGTWTSTATFTTARDSFASAEYNGYIYIIGGYSGSAFLNDIQYAKPNANGSITSWQTNSVTLPVVNNQLSAYAYNGYLYEAGGYGSGYNATAYVAPINADGSIANWVETASFTTARQDLGFIAYNGYLYIMGGDAGAAPFSDIQYAPIQAAGYLNNTWTTNATSLTTGRNSFPAVAYNNHIYIFGGYQGGNGGTIYSDTQYATINANGSIGSWATTSTFANYRYGEQVVAASGYMYLMGGQGGSGGSTFYSDIQESTINANGTLGTWSTLSTTLPNSVSSFQATVYNNYLYILGGSLAKAKGSYTYLSSVYYAALGTTSASVGAFTQTSSFTTARILFFASAYNGYLYLMGGEDSAGTSYNDIQYAPINANGSIGSFITNTTSFTTPRYAFGGTIDNGYVYIMGGYNGTTYFNDTQYAPINANGTIGTWTASTTMPNAEELFPVVSFSGYIYTLDGWNGSTDVTATYYSSQDNGGPGTLSAWTTESPNQLPILWGYGQTLAYNGYLYIIGGSNQTLGDIGLVYFAPINNDGSIGTWTQTSTLNTARNFFLAVAYNGFMYALGGQVGGPYTNTVEYTSINSNGTLNAWSEPAAMNLPNAEAYLSGFAYNGYLYFMGGGTGGSPNTYYNTVYYASINSNGTLNSWTLNPTTIPVAIWDSVALTYNGFAYLVGGINSTGALNSVLYAPINANGTIGTFNYTSNFNYANYQMPAVAYDGYLYVFTTVANENIQYAPINNNGTIGNFSTTTVFATTRFAYGGLAYKGHMYILGGLVNSTTYLQDIQYASIQAIPRQAIYSRLVDLSGINGDDPLPADMLLYGSNTGNLGSGGTDVGNNGGIRTSYQLASSSCASFGSSNYLNYGLLNELGNLLYMGQLSNGCSVPGGGRYLKVKLTLDDAKAATFPDATGAHTTITNLQIYMHSAPAYRLRGGATFTNDVLNSLDTTPN